MSIAEQLSEIQARLDACDSGPHEQIGQSVEMFMHAGPDIEFLLGLVGDLQGQLAKAADPVNGPVQLSIHRATCDESLTHCSEYRGRCVRSAEAVAWALGLDRAGLDNT